MILPHVPRNVRWFIATPATVVAACVITAGCGGGSSPAPAAHKTADKYAKLAADLKKQDAAYWSVYGEAKLRRAANTVCQDLANNNNSVLGSVDRLLGITGLSSAAIRHSVSFIHTAASDVCPQFAGKH